MTFIPSLLGAASYLVFPVDIFGWGALIGSSLLVALYARRLRRFHQPWTSQRTLLLAALLVATPLVSLNAGLRLPVGVGLPPPGIPLAPAGSVIMLLAALPWTLAAGLLGPLSAALLAGVSGLSIALFEGHSPYIPVVYAVCGLLLSAAIRQRYRTRAYNIIRRPLGAAVLVALIFPVLYVSAAGLSVEGTLPVRLDYAFSHLQGAAAAFGGQLIVAAVITQIISYRWPKAWYGKMSPKAPPAERSLHAAVIYRMAPFVFSLLIILGAVIWGVMINASRQVVREQMEITAIMTANALPFSMETGQNLIAQVAGDEQLSSLSRVEVNQVLKDSMNQTPFFHQLTLLGPDGRSTAGYPAADFDSTSPTSEEIQGVDLALKGVAFQSYSLPPETDKESGRIAFIASVLDSRGQVGGVLVGRTNLNENPFINPVIDNLDNLTELKGIGMVVDDQGMILYHSDPTQVGMIYKGETGEAAYDPAHIAPDGTRESLLVQPVPGRSWAVIAIVPVEVSLQMALGRTLPLIGLVLVFALIGYDVLRVGLGAITDSIQDLLSESKRIARGDLDHALESTGVDEVGQLRSSLEKMRLNLKYRIKEINRLLFVSRGVASALEMEVAVKPILEGALALGASSARLVLTKAALPDFDRDVPTQFGLGQSAEKYQGLDDQILQLTTKQSEVVLTNPRRANLENPTGLPAALMAVALQHENVLYGTLWVGYDEEHSFTKEEARFLSAVAGQAALAAANARLYLSAQLGRQQLEAILASTPDPVLVIDHYDQLLLANPAALALLNISDGLKSGAPIEKVIKQPELLDLLKSGSSVNEPQMVEVNFPGERIFYATASPVVAEEKVMGRVCVLSDITQFKELDALKSEFVSTVSHDLRSPLTLMRGYATMLQMVGELNEQQEEYIIKIVTGVENMSLLVNNLLDLGRIDAGIGLQLELVPLEELVRQVTDAMYLSAVQKQIKLNLRLPDEKIPLVEGDRPLLHQAIANLVDNAIKFTQAEGSVDVSLNKVGDSVQIEVRDTGIGVAPMDVPRLFEQFYRAEGAKAQVQSGTGLGLALVKSIVERHGGSVQVESQLGKGSIFTLVLPQRQDGVAGQEK